MICRRCGHDDQAQQCPVCGQPRPEALATPEQRRAYRQRLHVTAELPVAIARRLEALIAEASFRHESSDRMLVTYAEDNLPAFLKLWEQISEEPDCELLFNGQRRPYGRELWVPLLWLAADVTPST